jgi:hypothetical protein
MERRTLIPERPNTNRRQELNNYSGRLARRFREPE